jgi:hypothetical protein
VNGVGYEGGNGAMTSGRTLPWLQDVAGQEVWGLWKVGFRDVVICDDGNQFAEVYNLTDNPLDLEANREALKALLRSVATP